MSPMRILNAKFMIALVTATGCMKGTLHSRSAGGHGVYQVAASNKAPFDKAK